MAKKAQQPIEFEDDYELDLRDNIDDESEKEGSTSIQFTISSYGADYPVETVVKRLETHAFFVPPFQRQFVWSQRHASRFIESLLMGLPVPGIFLYKEAKTGRHLVVDGQQRLRTLQYFHSGLFLDRAFKLVGVRDEWEGLAYKDLPSALQLKLDDSIVHATIFQQDEPKDQLKSVYFVFERINSGGMRLSPQEIRNCISDGVAIGLARELNDNADWRDIFGERKNRRLKDQELVLRALAMFDGRKEYQSPMREFLNEFADKDIGKKDAERLKKYFKDAMALVNANYGNKAFRPSRALNAAVFEAVMVGLAERLDAQKSAPDPKKFSASYDKLMKNTDFLRACERATAREDTLEARQKIAISAFKSI
ncbi:uncharacterized protein with ParB-like and HNH nuclease domain [Bradyrhizobium elkanii]|uniref:DUF262 domain-containing protein n=1 Tax=Bradyrhizobium elkanii TaxID=29448 RepID=UPI0015C388D3|nr:DUF262 domain-containing protein [Bradyrhizobium elkanii]